MQHALRWRWLSPGGIQAVIVVVKPARSAWRSAAKALHTGALAAVSPSQPFDSRPLGPLAAAPRRRTNGKDTANSSGGDGGQLGFSTLCPAASRSRASDCRPSVVARATGTTTAMTVATLPKVTAPRSRPLGKRRKPSNEQCTDDAGPLPSSRSTTGLTAALRAPTAPAAITTPPTTTATAEASGMSGADCRDRSSPCGLPSRNLPPTAALLDSAQVTAVNGSVSLPQPLNVNLARAPLRRPPPSAEAVRRVTAAATAMTGMSYNPVAAVAAAPGRSSRDGGAAAAAATDGAAFAAAGASDTVATPVPVRHIVAAVDPDLNGALAVIFWDELSSSDLGLNPNSPSSGTSGSYEEELAAAAAAAGRNAVTARAVDEAENAGDTSAEAISALRLPAPPRPPADVSRWSVQVWDMPVSAAERQKLTPSGRMSRRRLLHVAGARAVLGRALESALPPPGEPWRVLLYGYVEVPPILPGDGNIAAYTSLWSTGAWLGLLAGSGFMVGSTPVRRWKTDLGLYGARSKDAGLTLARSLFPGQAAILRHKKNHGRADALLVAAWALGASVPLRLAGTLRRNRITMDELMAQEPGEGLAWGTPRPPTPTDAYGNLLTPEQDMIDEIEAAQSKVERQDQARAARRRRTKGEDSSNGSSSGTDAAAATATAAGTRRRRAKAGTDGSTPTTDAAEANGGVAAASSGTRRRRRTKATPGEAVADGTTPPQLEPQLEPVAEGSRAGGIEAVGGSDAGDGDGGSAGGVRQQRRGRARGSRPEGGGDSDDDSEVAVRVKKGRKAKAATAAAAEAEAEAEVAPVAGVEASAAATAAGVRRGGRVRGSIQSSTVEEEEVEGSAGESPAGRKRRASRRQSARQV